MSFFSSITKAIPRKKRQVSERELYNVDYTEINNFTETIGSRMQSINLNDILPGDKSPIKPVDEITEVATSLFDPELKNAWYETPAKPTRTRAYKRRKNFTKDDDHNVLHLFYDMGLSIREITAVTGMSTGSVHLRVKKAKNSFPNRRRNVNLTDDFIKNLKDLYANNADVNLAMTFQ